MVQRWSQVAATGGERQGDPGAGMPCAAAGVSAGAPNRAVAGAGVRSMLGTVIVASGGALDIGNWNEREDSNCA